MRGRERGVGGEGGTEEWEEREGETRTGRGEDKRAEERRRGGMRKRRERRVVKYITRTITGKCR